MDKNEFLERLNWATNEKGCKALDDITITISADGENVHITFRNGSAQKISKNETFVFAPFKNRLIFADATGKNGFVMSKNNKSVNRYAKFKINGREYLKQFAGNYKLLSDEFYEILYIEKEN